jgi:hypothetical protein
MPTTAYATVDDVVEGLAALEENFRSRQDRRSIFLTLYGVASSEVRDRVLRGEFLDPPWVHRYAVEFANLYREALDAYDRGRTADVPKAWRLCFDAARTGSGLVLLDLLLGVNAHVNNDLPLALDRISIDPDRAGRKRDHDAVNAILAFVMQRAVERLTALYAPGFAALDAGAGELDEMLSLFSLEVARDSAWEGAVSLANARSPVERALAGRLISSRAALVARLLLAPSRNPVFARVSQRLEQGSSWLTLLAAVKTDIVAR